MKFYRDFILIVFALLFVILISALTTPSTIMTYYRYFPFWFVIDLIIISLVFLWWEARKIEKKDDIKENERDKKLNDAIDTLNRNIMTLSSKLDKLDKLDKIDKLVCAMEGYSGHAKHK